MNPAESVTDIKRDRKTSVRLCKGNWRCYAYSSRLFTARPFNVYFAFDWSFCVYAGNIFSCIVTCARLYFKGSRYFESQKKKKKKKNWNWSKDWIWISLDWNIRYVRNFERPLQIAEFSGISSGDYYHECSVLHAFVLKGRAKIGKIRDVRES